MSKFNWKRTAMLAAVMLVAMTGAASAQEHGPPGGGKTLLELFQTTGPVGYLLVGVSMAGTALVIEHIVNIKREKYAPPEFVDEMRELIDQGQYDDAVAAADAEGGYMGSLLGAALRLREGGYPEMLSGLEMAAAEESFKLNVKISYLSLLGNVAPLLGLLGTVTGMISSFQVIETLAAPTPGDLAVGVYESLVNTTMGLFIAIVFLVAYFLFKNKVTKMALSLNLQAVDIISPMAGGGHAAK
jgi:biopolymer transport protein ExbB